MQSKNPIDHHNIIIGSTLGANCRSLCHNCRFRGFLKYEMEYEPENSWKLKYALYELMGVNIENYHPASAQDVCLGYERAKVLLADFMRAHDEGKIQITQFALNRSRYSGEVMVWSGTADPDFAGQMGHWVSNSYPHSILAVFDDVHHLQKYPDYYREFRKAFFKAGLNSTEVQVYFNDPRQLNVD